MPRKIRRPIVRLKDVIAHHMNQEIEAMQGEYPHKHTELWHSQVVRLLKRIQKESGTIY